MVKLMASGKNIKLRYRKEILSGEITPLLLKLGTPGAFGLFLQNSFNLVDRLFVSRLGEEELGAVGIAFIIQGLIMALGGGLSSGLRSHSSRSAGAERQDQIKEGARQGFYLIIVLGITLPLIGGMVIPVFYKIMGIEKGVYLPAVTYTNVLLWGAFFQFVFMCGNSLLRGIGEMKIPMNLLILSIGINVILDPLMIFGWGPFPPMGVKGAALATVIARGIAAILLTRILINEGILEPHFLFSGKIDTKTMKSIVKVALPAMFNRSLASFFMGFVYALIAPFGAGVTAAYTASYTFRRLILIPAHGFSGGAATMMGVNNGARRYRRTQQIFQVNARLTAIVLLPLSALLMIFAEPLLSLMLKNPESIHQGGLMIRILAPGYFFIALRTSASGGLNSLGEGSAAMVITLAQNLLFTLPLGWGLSRLWGLTGLWSGLTGGTLLSAILGMGIFFYYIGKYDTTMQNGREGIEG